MRLKDYDKREDRADADEPVITAPWFGIWELQVNSAHRYCGPLYHWTGVEVADKPVHQHVSAEGICG
jgi:hypothetical protein